MVRTGLQVLAQPCGNAGVVAGDDQIVDEAVASPVVEIGVGIAKAEQVSAVVHQAEIRCFDGRSADPPRLDRVGAEHDALLWRKQGTGAEDRARGFAVRGSGQVWMRAARAFAGEGHDSRPERREHDPIARNSRGLKGVEVGDQRRVGFRRLNAPAFRVAGADAEQQTPGMPRLDPQKRRGELAGGR